MKIDSHPPVEEVMDVKDSPYVLELALGQPPNGNSL
jgi:hypothetical protein